MINIEFGGKQLTLIPFAEVCGHLNMAMQTGYNRKSKGTFPVALIKVGGKFYARARDFERYLNGLKPDVVAVTRRGRPRSHVNY